MLNPVPKTLVVGIDGLLGRYFYRAYRKFFPDCQGTTRRFAHTDAIHFDLWNSAPEVLPLAKGNYRAAVIAVGVTGIEQCERNPLLTRRINVDGTLRLIDNLQSRGVVPIIFNSTSVFGMEPDGIHDQNFFEPRSEYARQKLYVEQAVRNSSRPYIMARLGKVFGLAENDDTYLRHIAQRLVGGQAVKAADDEIICPTSVEDAVAAIMRLQQKGFRGDIAVCSPEAVSRYDLALRVADLLGCSRDQVIRISRRDLPDGNSRAAYNVIDSSQLMKEFSFQFTPLDHSLQILADRVQVTDMSLMGTKSNERNRCPQGKIRFAA